MSRWSAWGPPVGRGGSFVLQHSGAMKRGQSQLTGLRGAMTILIEHGRRFYTFEYSLP